MRARKIKAGAVEINGEKVKDLVLASPAAELVIQAGKNWKKVTTYDMIGRAPTTWRWRRIPSAPTNCAPRSPCSG